MSLKTCIDNIFIKIFNDKNYYPKNYSLFETALTHKSINPNDFKNYEVLECRGDAYLNGFIKDAISFTYPLKANQHFISQLKFTLERTETFDYLIDIVYPGITNLIKITDEARKSIDFMKVKEDVFEAMTGAIVIYTDETIKHQMKDKTINDVSYNALSRFNKIRYYFINIFSNHIKYLNNHKLDFMTNYIQQLNQFVNLHKLGLVNYTLIEKIRTENGIRFKMKIEVNGNSIITEDKDEKKVKQNCAKLMLEYLTKSKDINNDIDDIYWEY